MRKSKRFEPSLSEIEKLTQQQSADHTQLSDASDKDWLAFLAYLAYLSTIRPESKAKSALPPSIWALALLVLVIVVLVAAGASDQIGEVVRYWPIIP